MPLSFRAPGDVSGNLRAAVALGLPQVDISRVVICGGSPTLPEMAGEVARLKARGAAVWALKAAWQPLVAAGIMPDRGILMDPTATQAAYVNGAPPAMGWYVASQCHPAVFAALGGRDIRVWHAASRDGGDALPAGSLVLAGCHTVGCAALSLALDVIGFREVHLVGLEGSFADGGNTHAYALQNGISDPVTVIQADVAYRSTLAMVVQVQHIVDRWLCGAPIVVHGGGLLRAVMAAAPLPPAA